VWSCGIILYIIIYNNYPWNKADIKDLYYKKYLTTIKYNKYFFIKYNNLLNKLLNPDPSKRPQIKEINFEDLL
jgi:serine/threonine protein kinase